MAGDRPAVRPAWASAALPKDAVDPGEEFSAAGWLPSSVPPARPFLNWILNYCSNGIRYLSRRGIADYDSAEIYSAGDVVRDADRCLYQSYCDANHGHLPRKSPAQWGLLNLYPQTAAECSVAMLPTNCAYPPGDVRRWGVVGDGRTDDSANLALALSCPGDVLVPAGVYRLAGLVSVAETGSNKTVTFMPGVTLLSSQPAHSASGILQFLGACDRLKIMGNGVQLRYLDPPSVRTNHVVYVNGANVTNLDIGGLDIQNGPNMGIAVFGGLFGSTASGCKAVSIHDCRVANTHGDGVHVEGFDEDVHICNIVGINNGDDVIAVVNYTGHGAPSHPTPTRGVRISNITSTGARTSTVALGGVSDFVINAVQETAHPQSSVFTIKATQAENYVVGNCRGLIDNVVSRGATKVLVFDVPGAVDSLRGTNYNRDIRVGRVVGYEVANEAFSISSPGPAGRQLDNIVIETLELHGNGRASSQIGYISNAARCRISDLRADGFAAGLMVANCVDFSWGDLRFEGFAAVSSFALSVTRTRNVRAGTLEVRARGCRLGVKFQGNAGVIHDGTWAVEGGAETFEFGSNTDVRGYFDCIGGDLSIGTVKAGERTTIVYPRAAPGGARILPAIATISNDVSRLGIVQLNSSNMVVLWSHAQAGVQVFYQISVQTA